VLEKDNKYDFRKNEVVSTLRVYECTVKAFNCGRHGNFGPFFASSVASLYESCTKNEQN
jgi:hypothetical protein